MSIAEILDLPTPRAPLVPPSPPRAHQKMGPLGRLQAMRKSAIGTWGQKAYEEDVIKGRFFGHGSFILNNPDAIRHVLVDNYENYTRTPTGIRVLRPSLMGNQFADLDKTAFLIGPFYYYCLALLIVLGIVMWRIVHSPFGLHLAAIRENPRKAEYLGVRVRFFRLIAFLISAFYCAVGGVILAVNTGQADPELAYWTHSGELVFMTVLGGFANFFGPLVGAFTFIFLKSELMGATQYWRFWLGAILVAIVVLFPRGLVGIGQALWARLRRS